MHKCKARFVTFVMSAAIIAPAASVAAANQRELTVSLSSTGGTDSMSVAVNSWRPK